MRSIVSLFSGAGGLDIGLEAAGFDVRLCVENDADCQATLQLNRPRWRLADPADIFLLTPKEILRQSGLRRRELDLLAGGPPCQPFSKASYWHRGDSLRLKDPRAKTLKSYMDVVDELLPRVILLENVEGIRFSDKDEGLRLLLSFFRRINKKHDVAYKPEVLAINAADYGVPQIRRRVLIVAARDGASISLPAPTHGADRANPYATAWDAIGDLDQEGQNDEVSIRGRWQSILPSIPEGSNYQWHTDHGGGQRLFGFRRRYWSFLLKLAKNKPSWTIQASPGPSTGPFHWRNRLLSVRELARIQTFPDTYAIHGNRRSAQRQIGNAVPPLVGEIIGREIVSQLLRQPCPKHTLKFVVSKRTDCPMPEVVASLPRSRPSMDVLTPHPGTGKGPGALARLSEEAVS